MSAIPANASVLSAPKPAWRMLSLLFAVFFLPVVAGMGLFWLDWRPGNFVSHGELVQPPRVLPPSGLQHLDGRLLPSENLLGKWLVVLPVSAPCDAGCEQTLQQLQQVHMALNKEQARVRRVLIYRHGIADSASGVLHERFSDLEIAVQRTSDSGKSWEAAFGDHENGIFVVDPQGNLMMHYADPVDMRGVLKDLERLLKYSWIR